MSLYVHLSSFSLSYTTCTMLLESYTLFALLPVDDTIATPYISICFAFFLRSQYRLFVIISQMTTVNPSWGFGLKRLFHPPKTKSLPHHHPLHHLWRHLPDRKARASRIPVRMGTFWLAVKTQNWWEPGFPQLLHNLLFVVTEVTSIFCTIVEISSLQLYKNSLMRCTRHSSLIKDCTALLFTPLSLS